MRRIAALITVIVVVLAPSASASVTIEAPATPSLGPVALEQLPGANLPVITSENVTYHGTIPLDSPAVGGEVVDHINGNRYFYATGLKGLSIYNISDPEVPVLTGYLPLPHSQNEDLKVSEDGTRAVIAADGALLLPVMPLTVGLHVIDTSDPAEPVALGRINSSNHTVECADPNCEWLYGSSGRIYDARNPTAITDTGFFWNRDMYGNSVGTGHALRRDETGIVISDTNPRLILDPRPDPTSATPIEEQMPGPVHPVVLSQGHRRTSIDSRLQHNNVRPDADEWVPRDPNNPADAVTYVQVAPGTRSISGTDKRPVMRPGELMIGNAESNLNNMCSSAGGLSTWSIVDFDKGATTPGARIEQLEVFRPLNGTWLDGSPRVNGLGCSGHWFTENDGIVAASWYEHGVRFFYINKQIGTIREIGYFQPVVTEAGAAYWVDDTHVYNVDYARGIDILSFDRSDELPSQRQLDRSWMRNLSKVGEMAAAERFACRAAVSGERTIRVKK